MKNYLAKVRELLRQFDRAEVKHVPRTENVRADILSKLASTKTPGNHRNLIQETLTQPSVSTKLSQSLAVLSIEAEEEWITPILRYKRPKTAADEIAVYQILRD